MLNLYEVTTQFYGYYEVPSDNFQRQLPYLIVTICCNTLKSFFKSVPIMKTDLKFYAVTSTKDSHQIPKSQVSLTESLKLDSYLPKKLFI